jgi:hypothetical protein
VEEGWFNIKKSWFNIKSCGRIWKVRGNVVILIIRLYRQKNHILTFGKKMIPLNSLPSAAIASTVA